MFAYLIYFLLILSCTNIAPFQNPMLPQQTMEAPNRRNKPKLTQPNIQRAGIQPAPLSLIAASTHPLDHTPLHPAEEIEQSATAALLFQNDSLAHAVPGSALEAPCFPNYVEHPSQACKEKLLFSIDIKEGWYLLPAVDPPSALQHNTKVTSCPRPKAQVFRWAIQKNYFSKDLRKSVDIAKAIFAMYYLTSKVMAGSSPLFFYLYISHNVAYNAFLDGCANLVLWNSLFETTVFLGENFLKGTCYVAHGAYSIAYKNYPSFHKPISVRQKAISREIERDYLMVDEAP